MIKKILLSLLLLLSIAGAKGADGDWKLHLSIDNYYYRLFDSPQRLYILAYGQPHIPTENGFSDPKVQLFVHDKSSGESLPYTRRNYLSGATIVNAQYNPLQGYLCVVYSDGNMDLIYDNDKIVNIPALKNATLTESKNVNSITFGLDDEQIYLATDFGFMVIDPKSGRITKARNYHHKINSIVRAGSKLVLTDANKHYVQDYDKPLLSLADFTQTQPSQMISMAMPMKGGNKLLACMAWSVNVMEVKDDNSLSFIKQVMNDQNPPYYSSNKQGYHLSGGWATIYVSYDGETIDVCSYPDNEFQTRHMTSVDNKTYYIPDGRKGVLKVTRDGFNNWGTVWTPAGHLSRPNASAAFIGEFMAYSDKYGMLVANQTHDRLFNSQRALPTLLSGLKNGEWTPYGYAYTNPTLSDIHTLASGITPDPNNPDLFYLGSRFEGLQVMDLSNPENVINVGSASSPAENLPGFIKIAESNGQSWKPYYLNFSVPKFDSQGNLWVLNEYQSLYRKDLETVLVWPAAAVKAKKFNEFIQLKTGIVTSFSNAILPLKASANRNLVICYSPGVSQGSITLLDHKGTLENSTDDRVISLSGLVNQDGGSITYNYIWCMFEDENTGTVWVGTDNGLFTFQPWTMYDNPTRARRIKVSRNDGTNLADYLLDGIDVRAITSDGSGSKWFATLGAGVVQTSSDGTHVMRQLTADNSYLPSDQTFQICYNKANNSMMIGTMDGLAEYFVPGASSGNDFDMVKIYPNPVRPDFVGYVTIEGLLDNSLIKIIDSEGNIVRELGSPMAGIVRWDLTTISGAKANSGVYFVMMSRAGENASEANVGKIVVIK